MRFGEIREKNLELWLSSTNRSTAGLNDNILETYECKWQCYFDSYYPADKPPHFSIFCSLGEWASILTDELKDTRFDNVILSNEDEENHAVIFRFYNRFLLAVSEMFTDFQDTLSILRNPSLLVAKKINQEVTDESRKLLDQFSTPGEAQELFDFINKICKHKVRNIHRCNHHLPIHFLDYSTTYTATRALTINNVKTYFGAGPALHPELIVMPKLEFFIHKILMGYRILDQEFMKDQIRFKTFCDLFIDSHYSISS